MSIRQRLPRWLAGCLAFVLMCALLAGPAEARTDSLRAVDRIRAALSHHTATPITRAVALPHSAATRPVYPLEGPTPNSTRKPDGRPALLSLADQRDAKGLRRLTLDIASAAPGAAVRLAGHGYAPGQRVDLFWDGANITGRRLVTADSAGRFSWPFSIPTPMTNGTHTVAAIEAGSAGVPAQDHAQELAEAQTARQSQATISVTGGLPPGTALPSLTVPDLPAPQVEGPNAQPQSAANAIKPWTFAVYMAGDNSLSSETDFNLRQMIAAGGTNANVNIVVLHDKRNAPTKYWEVTAAGTIDRTPATIAGNIDTGNPQMFVDFMGFVAQNYPAQHYALSIWNHGGGWKGVEWDDATGNNWTMADLRAALQGGLQRLGRPRYDALIFDACLMAQYEVGLELKPYVDILIASEETIPGEGTPYDQYLAPTLEANPATTAEDFGIRVVDEYAGFYRSSAQPHPDVTLSALRLNGGFDSFQPQVDAFAGALLRVAPTRAGDIQLARDATLSYFDPSYIDLGDFAAKIKAHIPDADVQASADALIATLLPAAGGLVLREAHGPQSTGSMGISAYLPSPSGQAAGGNGFDPRYDQLQIKGSPWYTFAKAFYTGQYPGGAPPTDTPPTPPPPAVASTSDIVYTSRVNQDQFDLNRIQSVASASEPAESFALLSDRNRNSYPRWLADGKYVVYASDRDADPNSRTGYEFNLFLIDADAARAPIQLTFSAVDCPDGPGSGSICTVEQSYDPAWLPGNSGILYTKLFYDLTDYPTVRLKQSIQMIDLSLAPGQPGYDLQLLPDNQLGDDIQFANADFNGRFLLFTYTAPESYGADFAANHIGFIDYGGTEPVKGYFWLNTPDDIASGNYLVTNYPAFHPGTNEFAFLYTRIGDPSVMQGYDPRPAPAAGAAENPYQTYDVGRMSFDQAADGSYPYTMESPIWPFQNAARGVGVNYRPSWRPDGSGNLTASVSTDGGSTYNIGLFLDVLDNNGAHSRVFLTTTDGYSYMPSWGNVIAADVQARLEVKPPYLEPGPGSNFYLSGSGFAPNESVQLARGASVIGTAQASADGTFEVAFGLTKGTPPGPINFIASGAGSGKTSNQAMLVVLAPRNGAVGFIQRYLSLIRR